MRSAASIRRPQQSRAVDTVRFILDAADRILEGEGAAGVTTTRVAAIAGVGIGTVYQYFPDRTALLREAERRAWARELEQLLSRIPAPSDDALLERAIVEVVTTTIDAVADRVAKHGLTLDDAELRAAYFELLEQTEEIVAAVLLATPRFRPANRRLGVRLAIEAVVSLAWVASLRNREAPRDRSFHEELCDLVVRYVLCDANAPSKPSPRR